MTSPPPKEFLEELYRRHHRLENLAPDPLLFARGFADIRDGEVAGLVAAAFAYGRVEAIMAALGRIFELFRERPRAFLERASPSDLLERSRGFYYRFQKDRDLAVFLLLLARAVERFGSLVELFRRGDQGGGIGPALAAFADGILSGDPRPLLRTRSLPADHPVRHLLSSPAKGGAAKRLCLFLRWMCRKDCLDPGYWQGAVDPARLAVPLDTHVARVGRELALTRRSAADWRTACEITAALRAYDPADPVRYDFSLFRYGMRGR
ncbi:MAG: TIGR02757 family protein [Deltaproteobacteria bacterium]|nr:TIGR02757 family protein [Deltaproteobacteria bacterium]